MAGALERLSIGRCLQGEQVKAKKRKVHGCTCADCRRHPRGTTAKEHRAINRLLATLNEKNRRRMVGVFALQWGWGSVERLHQITGLSCPTIRRGRDEVLQNESDQAPERVRRPGAGQPAVEKNILTS